MEQSNKSTIMRIVDGKAVPTMFTELESAHVRELQNLQRLMDIGEQAVRERDRIRRECKHEAFFTGPDFIYNNRICAVCGTWQDS